MKRVKEAIVKFFETTTLHGFKYLVSRYYLDRIGWVIGCLASACCAGVLCVVLWQRFQIMPALLQLRDLSHDVNIQPLPTVAFCQPSDAVVEAFLSHINTNENTTRLPATLANALQGKNIEKAQSELLEKLFELNKLDLLELLLMYAPDCSQMIRKCRWRDVSVDCGQLFQKEMTSLGVCCVATPARFLNIFIPIMRSFDPIKKLDIGLECVQGSNGLDFFTKYTGEQWIVPVQLSPGYTYMAHLTFTIEKDQDEEKLLDGSCISSKDYSRSQCLLQCIEKICGCSDPFRKYIQPDKGNNLPPCPLKQLHCLKTTGSGANEHTPCNCLPACQNIITKMVLERGSYKLMQSSYDPIYSGLNDTHSLVLRLRININASKLFVLKPTETWLTLLSSLGGVFNMFLGVGLFSALEFLFLLFVKIPMALRRSNEIPAPAGGVMFRVNY